MSTQDANRIELRNLASGLWIWRARHPAWVPGEGWAPSRSAIGTTSPLPNSNRSSPAAVSPAACSRLLEFPFERVIVSHGEPVHAREEFERALERAPWSESAS